LFLAFCSADVRFPPTYILHIHIVCCGFLKCSRPFFSGLKMCELFLAMIWTVVMLHFARKLLSLYDVICWNSNVAFSIWSLEICYIVTVLPKCLF
jgi:hypothetical protein